MSRRIPTGFGTEPGETLILLGDTHDEFDGSIWAQVTADHLGGVPPQVDLAREKLLAEVLTAASRDGLVSAAHDLSEGGLIQAVVEAALAGETGCRILLPEDADPFVALFSESAGRVLVAVPRTEESRFMSMCEARGLPATRIGVVDQGSDAVEVQGQFTRAAGRTAQHLGGRAPEAVRVTEPDPHDGRRLTVRTDRHPLLDWAWGLVRLDFVGVAFGALFFCLSLTPSLLPREWQFARSDRRYQRRDRLRHRRGRRKLFHRFVLRGRTWWPPAQAGAVAAEGRHRGGLDHGQRPDDRSRRRRGSGRCRR